MWTTRIFAENRPQLRDLAKKEARHSSNRHGQRLELAKRRAANKADGRIHGLKGGFTFKPETDGELAPKLRAFIDHARDFATSRGDGRNKDQRHQRRKS
jgi:hypothetical protein